MVSEVLPVLLNGAQVFYMAKVYPEKISPEEAESEQRWIELPESDKHYWNTMATNIIDIMDVRELHGLTRQLLKGADQCGKKPHYITQPFIGIVTAYKDLIKKYNLI